MGTVIISMLAIIKIAAMLPKQLQLAQTDFVHFYVWGRAVLEGRNPYTDPLSQVYARYGFAQDGSLTVINAPTFLWLFAPLTLLRPGGAYVAWVATQAASLCVILWLTHRMLGERLSSRGWRFVCAAALASTTVYYNFALSPIELALAALVLGAYACLRAERHTAASLVVTATGLVKLYPFVLLPWFVWRENNNWRVRAVRALLVAALTILVVIATRVHWWLEFFHSAMPGLKLWSRHHLFNYSIASFVAHLGYASHGFHTNVAGVEMWWAAGVGLGLAAIAVSYGICFRATADPEAQFCLLCIALLVGYGKTWEYYFVFMIFPMAVAAVRIAANPSNGRIIWFGLLLLALNALDISDAHFFDRHLYLKIFCNYIPLYGLIGLGVFFTRECLHSPANEKDHQQTLSLKKGLQD
jgi:hypothetical protein